MLNNIPPALFVITLVWIIRYLSKRANKNIQVKPKCENFMSRFFQVDVINDRALLDKDEIVAMTRIYHEISYVSPPELDENGWPKRVRDAAVEHVLTNAPLSGQALSGRGVAATHCRYCRCALGNL